MIYGSFNGENDVRDMFEYRESTGFFGMQKKNDKDHEPIMDDKIYQRVFDIALAGLRKSTKRRIDGRWEKIIICARKTLIGCETAIYVVFKEGDVFRTYLGEPCTKISNTLAAERRKLDKNQQWTTLALVVSSDGGMRTDLGYDDPPSKFNSDGWFSKYTQK